MSKECKETPTGRIPEEWEVVELGKVCEINPEKVEYSSIKIVKYIDIESVKDGKITTYKIFTKNNAPSRAQRLVKEKDIIVSTVRPNLKSFAIVTKEFDNFICSTGFAVLRAKEEKVHPEYLFYLTFYDDVFLVQILPIVVGSNYPAINSYDVYKIIIPLPPLPEQRKIAEILETIDKAIEKTNQIIEKYKRIKQGLMQDLLTKGIDEDWQIRSEETHKFKDSPLGRIPEEWEVVRLGDIFQIKVGGDIDKIPHSNDKTLEYIYPIYSNTIENKGLYGFSNIYTYPNYAITITARGVLGYAIPRFEKFNAIIRLLVLIPKCKVDIIFVSEYINTFVKFQIEETGVPQLTAPKAAMHKIPLPPLPEQQRIASILSQIDETIEKEKRYKEKLERIKQGLMEDLLTGRIRVNHLIESVKDVDQKVEV